MYFEVDLCVVDAFALGKDRGLKIILFKSLYIDKPVILSSKHLSKGTRKGNSQVLRNISY
jgi:hypothetical protein